MIRKFLRHKMAIIGAIIIGLLVITAIFSPFIAPYPPEEQDLMNRFEPPNFKHPLGTDSYGRDIFSRLVYGTRISLYIGVVAVFVSAAIGITLGIIAGYFGGWIDSLIQGGVDITWAFPAVLAGLTLSALFGSSLTNVMIAVALVYWGRYSRITRGDVLSIREREFVKAAKAAGAGDPRIILKHILPNAIPPAIVVATLMFGDAIAVEATLSFLGMGAQPPTPSWGAMLSYGRDYIRIAPWLSIFPGAAIMIVILGFNLIGDGLRDAIDPKLKY
ncbi:ABC transporter permease [Candidatus Bipolaricaulota bacterium]|nr:ABC transporter permease [Candidatus Bipolaricaulota bacterium]